LDYFFLLVEGVEFCVIFIICVVIVANFYLAALKISFHFESLGKLLEIPHKQSFWSILPVWSGWHFRGALGGNLELRPFIPLIAQTNSHTRCEWLHLIKISCQALWLDSQGACELTLAMRPLKTWHFVKCANSICNIFEYSLWQFCFAEVNL
jgi:hypothetical protein